MKRPNCPRRGFTLIELLIVVAIIAILAAIAVPNFLEAQVRAKVSRVQTDLRSLATGLEAYRVDTNQYPLTEESTGSYPDSPFHGIGEGYFAYAGRLSTPVAYIQFQPVDPFIPFAERGVSGFGADFYEYWSEPSVGYDLVDFTRGTGTGAAWVLWSWGPDRDADNYNLGLDSTYDSTNGTVSDGNLYRFGP